MKMNTVFVFLSIVWTIGGIDGTNNSNILRLSKPRSVTTIKIEPLNSNVTDDALETKKEIKVLDPLIGFSKNNPELDWKSYLKMFTESEEEKSKEDDLDVDFMKERFEKTGNSVQWLIDLYDPLRWTRAPGKLQERCKRDMDLFLTSLRNGKLWAARMSDASGRYSSQFHFGNGFWMGSSTLCKELNLTDEKSFRSDNHDRPPYPVRFHVARMYLTFPKELEFTTRQLFIGLCLPESCDRQSLTSMLKASANRVEREGNSTYESGGPKVHVVSVKPVPSDDYRILSDPKFYALASIVGTILLLMLGAMVYEYHHNVMNLSDIESSTASQNNNNNNNNNETNGKFAHKNHSENRRISSNQQNGFLVKCLLAFSPIVNGSKIISTEPAARDSLTCLHGMRVLSLGWVVLVHTYLQVFSIAENKTLRAVTERNFMFQTISNATFSVDTFFFISGLLVTILFYRSMGGVKNDKGNFLFYSITKFIIMILYRFLRLTPAYMFVLVLNEIAIKQALSTTVFSPAILDHITCEKYWWRNMLYINSLFPRTEMCMLWSWYMANDTQFYVLGILLLLISVKYFKTVVITVFFLILSSWLITFSVAFGNDYVARIQEPFALFDELYDKPWLRAGPYFIGMITGYILFKTNCKLILPLSVKFIGWVVSIAIMFAAVYGLYPGDLTVLSSSFYAAFAHTAWAIAIAFIVVQCCLGSANMINSFLSLRLIYPLSRLTYCAYLVHPIIMMYTVSQMDGPLHLHNTLVLTVYFGNLVASYVVSFCISITFEAPVVNLLKIAFTSNSRTR